jgi:hypothetical protein
MNLKQNILGCIFNILTFKENGKIILYVPKIFKLKINFMTRKELRKVRRLIVFIGENH